MKRLYVGVATYSTTRVSSRDICFTEASSEEEARGDITRALYQKSIELYGRAEISVVFVKEVPRKLIDKFATHKPDKPETTWAVIPDEQRGIGPAIPRVSK